MLTVCTLETCFADSGKGSFLGFQGQEDARMSP